MITLTSVVLVTHALRLWNFIAGVIGLYDIIHFIRTKENISKLIFPKENIRVWLHLLSGIFLCLFLILAGLGIPVFGKALLFVDNEFSYKILLLVAWFFLGLAGWLNVFKYSRKPKITAGLAVASLFIATLAAFTGN